MLLAVMMTGCSASALPGATPDAMTLVWEQTYGMEITARPTVSWHDECRLSANGGNRSITAYHGCIVAIVEATGTIELQRANTVSSSQFSFALAQWKHQLMLSTFGPIDGDEVARAQATLVAAGL